MATLVLRNIKGSPLSNTEADNNFQYLNNALGAAGSTTIPTPSGTGGPVLNIAPTISTNLFGGTQANTTRFPYAFASISSVTGGVDETTTYIGLISEAKGSGSYNGVGLYGVGYATGALRGTGVQGEGHVSLSSDTASAIGIRGYSTDTHSGGVNVGLFGDASGSTIGNYALYMNSGDIGSTGSQSWILGGNLSFTGAFSVTIPTLNVTTVTGAHNGTVGATSPNSGAFTSLSASGTISGTGFSSYLASPPAIGGTSANSGTFTSLSASGTISGTGFTNYFASPPAIGGTSANSGAFTSLSASGTISGTGFTNYFASPPAIGSTIANTGAFTTLSASGTISGTGFTNYFASPPAIGGTSANSGTFTTLTVTSTSAILISKGTTAQRPSPISGHFRFNSSLSKFEGYDGSAWNSFGNGGATGGGSDVVFYENSTVITTNYTITSGKCASSTGPITINSGVTVTIPNGSRWVIL